MPVRKSQVPKRIVIFIVGPTAVGKTALAVELARRVKGEIISCDSMQVYTGMRILSQAPDALQKKMARHHLVGVLDPKKEYSAALFRKRALGLIDSIINRGKVPIIAGGTGLYAKVLVDGLFPSPKADLKFRRYCQGFVSKYGSAHLHARLSKIDPAAAKNIHPNDARRVTRALEIYNSTGKTMTELKSRTKGLTDRYEIAIFGISMPRQMIYSNIDSRVDGMFKKDVLREARQLRRRALSKTARSVLGLKEISGYLDGEYGLERAKELMKMNTRRFAKRQLTWFRADKRIKWFDVSKASAKKIIREIEKDLGRG
ncbi:MAG: tRNA (adenosine(37)-N6)-dimethylallyltransferase MiaA [Candidatus Omnitrophica bacterium]|nr:tRNA (adenosine(37)-N6)-dimethylallyltransferase MiaA [Candidatus Omnitrophota bacterium]